MPAAQPHWCTPCYARQLFKQLLPLVPSIDAAGGRTVPGWSSWHERADKGYWFVPGGRIRKNESIREAFRRLTQAELGVELSYEQAHLLGVYDHFYSDCIFGESTSTHYVALGMVLKLTHQFDSMPEDQHDSFAWWPIQQALNSSEVHQHTKDYLQSITLKDNRL